MPVSALSAIGSATLPNEVTWLNVRAIQPSAKSVSDATPKASARRDPVAGLGHPRRDQRGPRRPGRARSAAPSARWPRSPPGCGARASARVRSASPTTARLTAGIAQGSTDPRRHGDQVRRPRSPTTRARTQAHRGRTAPGSARPGRPAAVPTAGRTTQPRRREWWRRRPPGAWCAARPSTPSPSTDSTSTSTIEPTRSSARWLHSCSASALSRSYRRAIVAGASPCRAGRRPRCRPRRCSRRRRSRPAGPR